MISPDAGRGGTDFHDGEVVVLRVPFDFDVGRIEELEIEVDERVRSDADERVAVTDPQRHLELLRLPVDERAGEGGADRMGTILRESRVDERDAIGKSLTGEQQRHLPDRFGFRGHLCLRRCAPSAAALARSIEVSQRRDRLEEPSCRSNEWSPKPIPRGVRSVEDAGSQQIARPARSQSRPDRHLPSRRPRRSCRCRIRCRGLLLRSRSSCARLNAPGARSRPRFATLHASRRRRHGIVLP
jgi:hypothetical protein